MFSSAALCFRNKSSLRMQNRPFIFKILYLVRVPATGLIYSDSIRAATNPTTLVFSHPAFSLHFLLPRSLSLSSLYSLFLFHFAFGFATINNTTDFLLLIPFWLADQSLRPKKSMPADAFLRFRDLLFLHRQPWSLRRFFYEQRSWVKKFDEQAYRT